MKSEGELINMAQTGESFRMETKHKEKKIINLLLIIR